MEKFTKITEIAAPMPLPNIDTDMIFPGRFLKTVQRTGLGSIAFYRLRYNEDGSENPDFVLNNHDYRESKIIIAGDNFGCGSSREHAPWALLDFGIRCIISTSFADIFFNNSFKNGILCIPMLKKNVDILMQDAENNHKLTVDLIEKNIIRYDNTSIPFEIDQHRRHNLLNGLDEIGITLESEEKIANFESKLSYEKPWI
ncbi:MAG: 3-isopropylmalate dehydratase small subunit [Rhodospirillaceae bacterium]|nr:3-isopropylmalate dehydratase small subunit [Rhodospirillaceae bacterium]|tara:strand:+ start:66770 stop:67369 length:600 start_codon:yes stop_codon:yes gene_type:complete